MVRESRSNGHPRAALPPWNLKAILLVVEIQAQTAKPLTASQRRAIAARGNVLVTAGAGAGKTHTLVERCLDLICREGVSLDEILIVTFTEAAAAEMRKRLRAGLEDALRDSTDAARLWEQLALFDAAHIGTLHSFCFRLVREHFHELDLDPQLAILDEGQARLLSDEILEQQFQEHYERDDPLSLAVQDVIRVYGGGRDEKIRAFVLRLHHYIQTRADADDWVARQLDAFSSPEPEQWRRWLSEAISGWRNEWLPVLQNLKENSKAAECLEILAKAPAGQDTWAVLFQQITAADAPENYPPRKKTALRKPLEAFFEEAQFLGSLTVGQASRLPVLRASCAQSDTGLEAASTGRQDACPTASTDPLAEDWNWVRGPMKTLLLLVREFSGSFSARKRADGALDFHDLEQFAIRLLWNQETKDPAPIADAWRKKLRFIFVDEYQDINAAQDKIISALARDNRFLVGDVKQSIYRFRLADPAIFRAYAQNPAHWRGQTVSLAENFRSREPLLNFINSLFKPLMHEDVGGIRYDEEARLKFGPGQGRAPVPVDGTPEPRAELLLRLKNRNGNPDEASDEDAFAQLQESEKEARIVVGRLLELKNSGHGILENGRLRPADWRDIAVLLRAPGSKAEVYAKEFASSGVPLVVERGGFYESSEISDLLSLLQLADNPLQDVPCIAVLRSPLAGCTLDELAEIRLAGQGHYWFALSRAAASKSPVRDETREKAQRFLARFSRWRRLAQQASLSQCLEEILRETHYDDWLLGRPRGAQRRANVERFLNLAEQFDAFQRQGLFRFLKFVEARREVEADPEVAPVAGQNAVRLMSIHQSKGLEFPVVVLADMGKSFNEQDLRGEIILDEQYGLCPRVKPPLAGGRYPSLGYWLARKNQRRELRGEELRLLYVAVTRARDTLILSGTVSSKRWESFLANSGPVGARDVVSANSFMDWLGLWFRTQSENLKLETAAAGQLPCLRWQIVDDSEVVAQASRLSAAAPAISTPAPDLAAIKEITKDLEWRYPFETTTRRAAKTSVTALRRVTEGLDDAETERPFQPPRFTHPISCVPGKSASKRPAPAVKMNAADFGVAHHKFLQHFAFATVAGLKLFEVEAKRLEKAGYLSADETAVLDLDTLADFWSSDVGKKIRANAAFVRRELPFTAGFAPQELDAIFGQSRDREGAGKSGGNPKQNRTDLPASQTLGAQFSFCQPAAPKSRSERDQGGRERAGVRESRSDDNHGERAIKSEPDTRLDFKTNPADEIVVVQGVADLVVLLPGEIWLLDFKTDDLRRGDIREKTDFYSSQLKLYARAVEKIYSRPVTHRWLHFLQARQTVQVPD